MAHESLNSRVKQSHGPCFLKTCSVVETFTVCILVEFLPAGPCRRTRSHHCVGKFNIACTVSALKCEPTTSHNYTKIWRPWVKVLLSLVYPPATIPPYPICPCNIGSPSRAWHKKSPAARCDGFWVVDAVFLDVFFSLQLRRVEEPEIMWNKSKLGELSGNMCNFNDGFRANDYVHWAWFGSVEGFCSR